MCRLSLLRITLAVSCVVWPALASAQTSTIAGTVRDASGGVLPGVTVEVSSPALIEKVRTVVSDAEGRYSVVALRPGTYRVTFALPGFGTVTREGVELTSDFTAVVNVEMKVGTLEETITVTGESPIVDTQTITQRHVMTREVLDVLPTGRNIQAIGIMIPGTTLAFGGGAALSRDVGGSGSLQQSPLQYRGSADTIQTIEGLRLNNLCAQGAYSGVYWNDASFEEISYITGADSTEMGTGGMRVNMVPRDGGNQFRGQIFGNYAGEGFGADNCGSPGAGQPCTRENLRGSTTRNPANALTNVSRILKIWDFNPSIGGPIKRDRMWFHYTFRHWGVEKTVPDSYFDADPSQFRYVPDFNRPGVDDGHIVSNAIRVAFAAGSKDKFSVYHDNQRKYRDHWGIQALVPPEATAIQVTPTSFVNVTKWTRTHTNRLLFEAGFGIYNQEYTELYQPEVVGHNRKVWDFEAIRNSRVYNVQDQSNGRHANAWPAPADHFSVLRTLMAAASYVTGSHSFRFGTQLTNGDWRLIEAWTGDVQPITYNAGVPVSATFRLPMDARNGIKRDLGIFLQDRWVLTDRVTLNAGVRFDQFIGDSRESEILPNRFNAGVQYGKCSDGKANPRAGCAGEVQNWKDISPRVGVAWDVFGTGRTAVKASLARYIAAQNVAVARQGNPVEVLTRSDTRTWRDLDGNGLPFDANGNIQLNELTDSTATPTFGRNVSTVSYDPEVLNGWFKRGYNVEWTVAAQHALTDRLSVNGGYYRRKIGNETFTDDLRFDASSFDYFCVTAPADTDLPGGGGYRVCGVPDLKPSVFAQALPANNLIRFVDDFGGTENVYKGFDVNLEGRFRNGAFLKGGLAAGARTFNTCNLAQAGIEYGAFEEYEDGTRACDRYYPFRPDLKISGSYPLPFGIQLAGTYQFTRGLQAGGTGGTSRLANWAVTSAVAAPFLGRNWTGVASRTVALIREGSDYGKHNLNQLDLRFAKRFDMGRTRLRLDFDLYNIFNSSWPFSVNNTYSTAATSQWQRPTNVLQHRFFKLGGQVSF
jgi:outer membrane receptor protein involved in Fe transport